MSAQMRDEDSMPEARSFATVCLCDCLNCREASTSSWPEVNDVSETGSVCSDCTAGRGCAGADDKPPPSKSCRETMLKHCFMMWAMTLCSKLRWPSCLPMVRLRRKAKVERGPQQQSNCRSFFLWKPFLREVTLHHNSCSDATSSERCDGMIPICEGGCK